MLALTFAYNGIADAELKAAKSLGEAAGVDERRVVRLPDLREAADIPRGVFRGLPPTYIPMRNAVFYSYAASVAEEVGAGTIAGGHNRDDREVFPDSRVEFFSTLQRALRSGSTTRQGSALRVVLPLARMSKAEVVSMADRIGVPLELTWSCHRNGSTHCWKCAGCKGRVAKFREARVADPLLRATGKIT